MPPSFPSSMTQSRKHNLMKFVEFFIGCCCAGLCMRIFHCFLQLYGASSYNVYQCQVKSIDIQGRGRRYYPLWNVMVNINNERKIELLKLSSGETSKDAAWQIARNYKIDETYPCYRSRSQNVFLKWGLQWQLPSKAQAYATMCIAVLILVLLAAVLIYIRHRRTNSIKEEEQVQLEAPLKSEEHPQVTVPMKT